MAKNEKIIKNDILINWVIKETYSKYIGLGLHSDFRNINAEQLLIDNNLKNISTDKYYCYVYGKEKIEKIKYIERIGLNETKCITNRSNRISRKICN